MEKETELAMKFSMFEQQIQAIHQQMQAVEQAILELSSISQGLEEMKGKKDQEILAQIGRGIFVKAKLLSEELVVDVGGKNFVEKDIPHTQTIIDDQLLKLKEIQEDLSGNLEQINQELTQACVASREKEKTK